MADHCGFCDTRRPSSGTNMLVLGDQWLEFCAVCGETEMLTNGQTGEERCIADVFEMLSGQKLENRLEPEHADSLRALRAKNLRQHEEQIAAQQAQLKGGLNRPSGGEAIGLLL